jgi:hypothetical protein
MNKQTTLGTISKPQTTTYWKSTVQLGWYYSSRPVLEIDRGMVDSVVQNDDHS